ncbi:MAG: MFS transporter [Methylococcales bacterium]
MLGFSAAAGGPLVPGIQSPVEVFLSASPPSLAKVPYFRLSAFYALYFSVIGSLLPYWSLYLQFLGFNASEIGQLTALLVGTKIIAPNIWGWVADRGGRGIEVIRMTSLIAAIAFTGTFLGSGFVWMATVTVVFSFFWNAALPQFEALTLSHLKRDPHDYSRIRLWGSIGFVLAVLLAGRFLDDEEIGRLPVIIAVLLAGIWLVGMVVPGKPVSSGETGRAPELIAILRQPTVLAFLTVVCLVQVAHGPYSVFYSIYLKDHGYDNSRIGLLWSLGVLAEIALFVFMPALLKRFSLRSILLASVLTGTLRWVSIGVGIDQPLVLVLAQLLHATTFGSTHVVAIHFVHRYFPHESHGRGQALYSSMSFGLGGMLGSFTSGELWDRFGPIAVYGAASCVCLLAYLIGLRWIGIKEAPR